MAGASDVSAGTIYHRKQRFSAAGEDGRAETREGEEGAGSVVRTQHGIVLARADSAI